MLLTATLPAAAGFEEGLAAYGRGDYRTALREWKPLAENGDAVAQHNIGHMYANGLGVQKNYHKAAGWYAKAAKGGLAKSQYTLGHMYATDQGVPRNLGRAVYWFRKAAEQGIAKAQFLLAEMYNKGWGVQKNTVLSYMWNSIAAAQGHKSAAKRLEIIGKHMTPAQLAKAKAMAANWKPKGKK
jgi:TPR repeat protein